MTGPTDEVRTRRPPPRFVDAVVDQTHPLGGRLVGLDLRLADLGTLRSAEPASSIRLLVPSEGSHGLEVPEWTGNEFLLADGRRPTIRTLTPCGTDEERQVLRLAVLRHGDGPLASWLDGCAPGDPVAVSGPGRGLVPDPSVRDWLLAGDESAIPAMVTLLDTIPDSATVRVLLELADGSAPMPDIVSHPRGGVDVAVAVPGTAPGDSLVDRLVAAPPTDDTLLWAAGEAAAMQRIRRGVDRSRSPRSMTVVRGYWKLKPAGSRTDGS